MNVTQQATEHAQSEVGRRRKRMLFASAAVLAAVVCASCSAPGADSTAPDAGLPVGASKADYVAAFADVEPIQLVSEYINPTTTSPFWDEYLDEIEEWSGGKIEFERYNSSALSGSAASAQEAIADGRVDIGIYIPAYAVELFPAASALTQVSGLSDQSPLSSYATYYGWTNELAVEFPEFYDEAAATGIQLLIPTASAAVGTAAFCADGSVTSAADFRGKNVASGARQVSNVLEALGATPVTLPSTEMYQGMERGVISCGVTSTAGALVYGLLDMAETMNVTPNDPEYAVGYGFPATFTPVGMNLDTWESLPLVAQQLIFDKGETLVAAVLDNQINSMLRDASTSIPEIAYFEADVLEVFREKNHEVLDAYRENGVFAEGDVFAERVPELISEWIQVAVDNGFDRDVTWDQFADWVDAQPIDGKPFAKVLFERVLNEMRPQ